MKGDSYIAGAAATAYSIKNSGSTYDVVCMVTPDVTEEGRERLRIVCTNVVEVPYLQFEVKKLKTTKQQNLYDKWVDVSFTKWNALSLTEYVKVLFIDADKIVLQNIDHLFSHSTPAGTFASPWSETYVDRERERGWSGERGKWTGKGNKR